MRRLLGMHLVSGIAVVCDAAHHGHGERRHVRVVGETVPFAPWNEDELAGEDADRIAVRKVEPRSFEDVEELLGMRMPM